MNEKELREKLKDAPIVNVHNENVTVLPMSTVEISHDRYVKLIEDEKELQLLKSAILAITTYSTEVEQIKKIFNIRKEIEEK